MRPRAIFAITVLLAAIASVWLRARRDADGVPGPGASDHGPSAVAAGPAMPARWAPGIIVGTVIGPDGGGVEGATVTALGPRAAIMGATQTALAGAFRLELPPGEYTLTASAAGFTPGRRTDIGVVSGASSEDVRVRLWRGGVVLHGRVLDSGGGPVPGARVVTVAYELTSDGTHEPRMFHGQAGEDGVFRLDLPRGSHRVTVEADGYASVTRSLFLSRDTEHEFSLNPAARIAGRVTDARNGQPVAGARVQVLRGEWPSLPRQEAIVTGLDGRFRFDQLVAGRYAVAARKDDLVAAAGPFELTATEAIDDLELVVMDGARLEGSVRSATGAPIAHARIAVRPMNPDAVEVAPTGSPVADENGRFAIEGIISGVYSVQVGGTGHSPVTENVNIEGAVRRDFVLQPSATISGTIVDAGGRPVTGAQVTVDALARTDRAWASGVSRSDEQGRFVVRGVAAGDAQVTAVHDGTAGATTVLALAPGGQRDVVVRLGPGARVSGVVSWDDGSPAGGAGLFLVRGAGFALASAGRAAQDGSFVVDGLPPGIITLRAIPPARPSFGRVPPGGPHEKTLTLQQGEHATDVRLVLARPAAAP